MLLSRSECDGTSGEGEGEGESGSEDLAHQAKKLVLAA